MGGARVGNPGGEASCCAACDIGTVTLSPVIAVTTTTPHPWDVRHSVGRLLQTLTSASLGFPATDQPPVCQRSATLIVSNHNIRIAALDGDGDVLSPGKA